MTALTAALAADTGISGQAGHLCACAAGHDGEEAPARSAGPDRRAVRSWPLLVLAAPAAVAVWSGWVGIGQMTGFGMVHPLPGIWDSLRIDTAVTLPVGVEAYVPADWWVTRTGTVDAVETDGLHVCEEGSWSGLSRTVSTGMDRCGLARVLTMTT
jgi:hypothetical protein